MKKIDVSDAVYAALQRLASGFHRTPDEVLANLLLLPHASTAAAAPVAAFSLGPDSRAQFTAADHDLALLGWIAVRHAEEFAEFIRLKRASHRRRCAARVAQGSRAFPPVISYRIRAKNHSAIAPIPMFGSHAATAGSTICFVASDAATFANT